MRGDPPCPAPGQQTPVLHRTPGLRRRPEWEKPVADPDMSPKGLMSAVSEPILCWGEEESPAEPEHSGSSFLAAGRVGSAFSCVCVAHQRCS